MSGFDLKEIERRMRGALGVLKQEFGGLRTGRASASLLDPIMVMAYGAPMPLNQLATINVPESRLITVQVWDRSQVGAVERAIREWDLGLNPATQGNLIRVPLPALPELADLLRARGRTTEIQRVERAPRTFDSFDGLATFLRRQLWIAEDGEKERRFRAPLANMARERDDDGWTLASPPVGSIGILTWRPSG